MHPMPSKSRSKRRFRTLWLPSILVIICALLLMTLPALAQDTSTTVLTETTIAMGEIKTGEVTAAISAPRMVFQAATPQTLAVQVLGTTPGFSPIFRVIDPDGITIASVPNPTNQTISLANLNLTSAGAYTIEVQNALGTPGSFVITVQAGSPTPIATPLTLGQEVSASVYLSQSVQLYTFGSSATEILLLTVRGELTTTGPVVVLKDGATNDTLALSNLRQIGVRFRIPTGTASYRVEVMASGSPDIETYKVCLETESGSVTCGAPAVVPTATLAPTVTLAATEPGVPTSSVPLSSGPCAVVAAGAAVNVRFGPGTNYDVVGALSAGVTAQVIGRLNDNSWYQIQIGSTIGWVSASVVTRSGDCVGVPLAAPPPSPTPIPTATFTPTFTPTLTFTPSFTPSPTLTPSITPTSNFICCIVVTFDAPILDPGIFEPIPPGP